MLLIENQKLEFEPVWWEKWQNDILRSKSVLTGSETPNGTKGRLKSPICTFRPKLLIFQSFTGEYRRYSRSNRWWGGNWLCGHGRKSGQNSERWENSNQGTFQPETTKSSNKNLAQIWILLCRVLYKCRATSLRVWSRLGRCSPAKSQLSNPGEKEKSKRKNGGKIGKFATVTNIVGSGKFWTAKSSD